jgi:hypothetical protein
MGTVLVAIPALERFGDRPLRGQSLQILLDAGRSEGAAGEVL